MGALGPLREGILGPQRTLAACLMQVGRLEMDCCYSGGCRGVEPSDCCYSGRGMGWNPSDCCYFGAGMAVVRTLAACRMQVGRAVWRTVATSEGVWGGFRRTVAVGCE